MNYVIYFVHPNVKSVCNFNTIWPNIKKGKAEFSKKLKIGQVKHPLQHFCTNVPAQTKAETNQGGLVSIPPHWSEQNIWHCSRT